MKKRVLALLLCLLLCVSLFPVNAFADDCNHEIVKLETKTTCGEAYKEHYKCTKCLKLFSDERGEHEISAEEVALPLLVHESRLQHVEADPEVTCTKGGNLEYWVCTECGQMYADKPEYTEETSSDRHVPIPDYKIKDYIFQPLGHNMTYYEAVPHSCFQDGNIAYYYCENCEGKFSDPYGENQLDNTIDYAGHTKEEHLANPRTCDENGNSYYFYCSACEKYYNENGEEITENSWVIPAGHDYVEHPAEDPTCISEGNALYYTCSGCDRVFDANQVETTWDALIIPKTPHNLTIHVEAVPKSCWTDGNIEYWQCDFCKACFADAEGTMPVEDVYIPASHELVPHPAKAATCTENGNIAYSTCENCDIILDENGNQIWQENTIAYATGHNPEKQEATFTCTEDGYAEHYKCLNCERLFKDEACTVETSLEELATEAPGHKLTVHVEAVPKTCSTAGNIEYWQCEVCDACFADAEGSSPVEDVTVPASHEFVETPAKAATCTENGNIAYRTCSVCGIVFDENGNQIWQNDTIAYATGHKPEKQEATVTCTEAGYAEHYKCLNCGKLFKDEACTVETTLDELATAALGHAFDETGWCTRCGAISPEAPAYESSTPTNDGVVVHVSAPKGVFPADARLIVDDDVPADVEEKIDEAVDAGREKPVNVAEKHTYNIKVVDRNGNEIQPADGSLVKVSFSLAKATNENLNAQVYHVEDVGKEAEKLETSVEGEKVVAVTDGFSYYTVEFTYDLFQYVLPSGNSVPLSQILNTLKLTGTVKGVRVTAPEYFTAVQNASGEWVVTAHQPFSTQETLFVTLTNGTEDTEYTIIVTDTAYTVKVNSGKATVDGVDNPPSVDIGKKVTITAAVPSGKTFEKWTIVSGLKASDLANVEAAQTTFTMPANNVEVTATSRSKVTFVKNLDVTVTNMPADRFVDDGTVIKSTDLTSPSAEGYRFLGWYDAASGGSAIVFPLTINSNTTIYAHWIKTWKVYYYTAHGKISDISPNPQIIDDGSTTKEPAALTWIGYKWGGWYSGTSKFDFKTAIHADTTIYANWIPDFKITKGDGGTAHYGSTYPFTLNYYYPDYMKNEDLFEVYIAKKGNDYGKTLSKEHYVVTRESSTGRVIVTLKATYIRSLEDGATYYIYFDTGLPRPPEDLGYTEGTFKVSKAPKTGDESNVTLWVVIAVVSALAIIAIIVVLTRKRKKGKLPPTPPENLPPEEGTKKTKKKPKE